MELPEDFDLNDAEHMKALVYIIKELIPKPYRYSLTVYNVEDHEGVPFSEIRTVCRADSREQLIHILRQSADDIDDESAPCIQVEKINGKVKH